MSSRDNPFDAIERVFEQMTRQLDQAASAWESEARLGGGRRMGIDVADRDSEVVVTADLPGFEAEDVDCRLVDDVLHVGAVHERESQGEEGTARWGHRRERSMRESVRLPARVEAEAADATLRNGVLTVRLPKVDPQSEDGHRIDVE